MGNRTLGDDIEDHYYGTQGINTGSFSNSVGLQEYERKKQAQAQATIGGSHSAPRASTPPEESLASMLALAAWAAIAYYGIAELAYVWYGPVGVGLVVGICVYRILAGPLRFLMSMLKWAIAATRLGGLIYFAVYILNTNA